jgi:hypothetical protein
MISFYKIGAARFGNSSEFEKDFKNQGIRSEYQKIKNQ